MGAKQIRNLLKKEAMHQANSDLNLQKRLENVHKDEHRLKLEAHIKKKQKIIDKRGPGLYSANNSVILSPKDEKF